MSGNLTNAQLIARAEARGDRLDAWLRAAKACRCTACLDAQPILRRIIETHRALLIDLRAGHALRQLPAHMEEAARSLRDCESGSA